MTRATLMKRVGGVNVLWSAIMIAVMMSSQALAETVLIGAGVRNGDFNDDVSLTDSRNFDVTPSWFNIGVGSDQNVEATRTNFPTDGTRHAVLASGGGGNRLHAQNTLYTIEEGDFFRISYEWRDAGGWDPADRIEVRLFVTDTDGIGGVPTVVSAVTSAPSAILNTYQAESMITPSVANDVVGKTLFVRLTIMDGNGDANDFAQLDNFELVVNPDPVSAMLIGPGLRNGDFNEDLSPIDSRNFEVTPVWQNIGTGAQTLESTRTNFPTDGTRHAVVASTATRVHGQNSMHVVAPGDVFRVTYEWRDGFNWDDGQDQIEIRLFVTDTDLIGGVQTVVASMPSMLSINNDQYQKESAVSAPAAGDVGGKRLFVGIYTIDGNGDDNDFAQLDNFTLTVNPVDQVIVGAGVLNGDFEADVSAGARSFDQTPNWWNLGTGGQTIQASLDTIPFEGNRRGVLSSSTNSIMSINTFYNIGTGEVYRIRYAWRDGNFWTAGTDEVEVRLFVTDNDRIGGVQTEVARFLSGVSTQAETYELVEVDAPPITDPAFIGKRLFMSFNVEGGTVEQAAFAALDNVELIANPTTPLIPPPHTVDIVNVAFSFATSEITLKSTGVANYAPRVLYSINLRANPQAWLLATVTGNTYLNGTNTVVFAMPVGEDAVFIRVEDEEVPE